MNDDVLDVNEAADHLRASVRTLETWRESGTGPPYVPLRHGALCQPDEKPTKIIYLRQQINEWLLSLNTQSEQRAQARQEIEEAA